MQEGGWGRPEPNNPLPYLVEEAREKCSCESKWFRQKISKIKKPVSSI
jgi:hypothetical protein